MEEKVEDNRMRYKGFLITPSKEHPRHYVVATENRGGKIPNILSGLFTTPSLVKELIDNYTPARPVKKEEKNAETRSKI